MHSLRTIAILLLLFTPPAVSGCRDSGIPDSAAAAQAQDPLVQLPNKEGTFKFGVLGDFGTGDRTQYQLAEQMGKTYDRFKYNTVILVGDNLYGSERPQDFEKKFERPYKKLLDSGVKFYASLGNHDAREQRYYKLFNMDGNLYYTFSPKAEVRFFALESTYMVPEQLAWLEKELKTSGSHWKIVFFHHPLYSSGERHGSNLKLREVLEPLFLKYNVSLVLQGHDHFYERLKPQKGIHYITQGGAAKLRAGNIRRNSPMTAHGFDTDNSFTLVEIVDDHMFVETISRRGAIVDSSIIPRRELED